MISCHCIGACAVGVCLRVARLQFQSFVEIVEGLIELSLPHIDSTAKSICLAVFRLLFHGQIIIMKSLLVIAPRGIGETEFDVRGKRGIAFFCFMIIVDRAVVIMKQKNAMPLLPLTSNSVSP